MSNDKNQHFLQNLTIIIALILGVLCLLIVFVKAVGNNGQSLSDDQVDSLINQTQPVGRVSNQASEQQMAAVATPSENRPAEDPKLSSGRQVYDTVCTSCHSTGLPNIPQLGNTADWEERIARGEVMYENAINGYTGTSGMMMPPRGGNPSLSNDEVRAAVDYIIESSR